MPEDQAVLPTRHAAPGWSDENKTRDPGRIGSPFRRRLLILLGALVVIAVAGVSIMRSSSTTTTHLTTISGLAWRSGASGPPAANGSYAIWRGRPLDIIGTWADNPDASTALTQLQSGGDYSAPKWHGDIDIALGAIGSGESWAAAATGAYDARWQRSLTNLKSAWGAREGTVYIRFAHEMNGNWYPWAVNPSNAQDFISSWKRYRALQQQIMPAAKLVFSVNRESSGMGMDWRKAFPGRGLVDVMSVDYYNQFPFVSSLSEWSSSITQTDSFGAPKGLQTHLNFAKSVGLPLAVSEWSNNADMGDSPAFLQGMHSFFRAHAGDKAGHVLYEVQFNVDQDANRWSLYPVTRAPRAAAAYRSLW